MIDLRSQAERHDRLLRDRLDTLLPELLSETGIDCWVLVGREYAEDPVLATMLPATWLSARRRTILVMTPDDRFAVSRYPVGTHFRAEWSPEEQPDQWRRLGELLKDLDPGTIGVGISPVQAHADGLTHAEHEALVSALPDDLRSRLVPAGTLGVRWLETRLPDERATLEEATSVAHGMLRRGLSREGVTPGTTTTTDLEWWYRQTVHDAGLESWFHPTVSIQRPGDDPSPVIVEGDLVHVDFGIVFGGMCTDQQEHAYVVAAGESSAPEGLAHGLSQANRIQDLLLDQFVIGATGNAILERTLEACEAENLEATVYTHSIGLHGHGAGMTIGLWDRQGGVPGPGDHPLHPNTAYSIELMGVSPVPEWDDVPVRFMLEQDAWFDGERCTWLDGRQTELHLI
ncbi:MAG: M24 family metallopeptidase [Acidimicrobiia bacterium]|nr:M24 family metallopeptidase [Acidimicrobiia bacterium]